MSYQLWKGKQIMKDYEQLKMMEYPKDRIDLVIDTDAATEIDDQFAIAYALLSRERFHITGIYAAPFAMNEKTKDPNVGMQMSYDEIVNIMHLCGENPDGLVFHGAGAYGAPQPSDASMHLVQLAKNYSPEKPLYVAAIGAITNIATAILQYPDIINRIVLVWLAGNDFDDSPNVYNIYQDVKSAQVVFDSRVPFIHVPCNYVTSHLLTGIPELENCIGRKNALCDYLVENVKKYGENHFAWGKQIWDIGVIGYLMNENFSSCETVSAPILTDNITWSRDYRRHLIKNVKHLDRDAIFRDMYKKLGNLET